MGLAWKKRSEDPNRRGAVPAAAFRQATNDCAADNFLL